MVSQVFSIFQDAVRSQSTHKKNISALLKVHKKQKDSKEFISDLEACVLRVLLFPKGDAEADRAIKFICNYLEFLSTKKDQDSIVEGNLWTCLKCVIGLKI